MSTTLSALLNRLQAHEHAASRAFNLTPSENRLSPLATLPFALDAYSRYFLDDLRLFGEWCFPAGRHLGAIEHELLHPLLKRFTKSRFVNVRPISGINCMTIAFAAWTQPGDKALVLPSSAGGHASTRHVAKRLGVDSVELPFRDAFDIDEPALRTLLSREKIRLVYIDQSTQLFPLDPKPIRDIVDAVSPDTLIHYDSSHINGLIFGGAVSHPLERGAHSFGGSTHKTLPGPHKGFIATDSQPLADAFEAASDHFVSQHKTAEVVSLALTLMEFRDCGGDAYAHRIVENAHAFASELAACGLRVASREATFTACHQVWVAAEPTLSPATQSYRLEQAGIFANIFRNLPTVPTHAFRLSTAEFTRMGGDAAHARQLARAFTQALRGDARAAGRIAALRARLSTVRYCYDERDVLALTEFVKTGARTLPELAASQTRWRAPVDASSHSNGV
ncbi:hypothetical protein WKR88_16325 [Trinickia caryophylli]|uniref:hypothetical protein n=1 Tax=Trinickia caryophylli TaxID=28094 RepID=UPI001304F996|nr:hypothetical protein [Trinickia caryophylli]WQE14297.1 hypothetical protein U0034_26820 [Trinickia caryophylli]GLU33189.1 serine hydroxymethyltransferase [Trinickia caryophylli]